MTADLQSHCDLLRSLHRPGDPLLLPNAWDVATARAVVAAGFPVVATTSEAVAATLGYEDEERAPADEMLAAAGRMARSVEVPVTVDAEAGYGMDPADARECAAEHRGRRLQSRGHRPHRRESPRSRPARGVAQGGSPGRVGRRVPARDQRPDRHLLLALSRCRGGGSRCRSRDPGGARSRGPTSARTPTSRPASTASTRSASGRRTRCAASCPRSAAW